MKPVTLPIDQYIQSILHSWQNHESLIINASAGSGKTTRLPYALSTKASGRVIVLEPRKLAAKMAAQRVADENGLKLGEEIGYAYRDDKRFSDRSKLIFFTEGTFLHYVQNKDFLKSVNTIIFDEFHERHLETDLCLAVVRFLKEEFPQIKIILMSATIDNSISVALNAKVIEIHNRIYDVKTHFLPNQPSILNLDLATKVIQTISNLPSDGDILIFAPGIREINEIQNRLGHTFGKTFILHSEIEKSQQEKVMETLDERKIIIATNIAESSVTIPGIKYVIDSGIARTSEFNPWTGLKTLVDRPITKSSAIQRMYRAGRTQAGECFRLYAEFDYNERESFSIPEILRTDLNDVYLLSTHFSHKLQWITSPPADLWSKAKQICILLGLCNDTKLTACGDWALKNNLNARIARILWEARETQQTFKHSLLNFISNNILKDDPRYLTRKLHHYLMSGNEKNEEMSFYLLSGLIDQVARWRPEAKDFIHYSGKTLRADKNLKITHSGLYLLTQISPKLLVEEALDIEEDWLLMLDPSPLIEQHEVHLIDNKLFKKSKTMIGSLAIDEVNLKVSWSQLSSQDKHILIAKMSHRFKAIIEEFKDSSWYKRLAIYCKLKNINIKNDPLIEDFFIYSDANFELIDYFFKDHYLNEMNIDLDYEVPEILAVNKKKFKISYENELSISGNIQDFYGCREIPKVLGKEITLILIGPNKRPFQYTKDLSGFWDKTYVQFLKEWRREYPRHHWPDEPDKAPPLLLKRMLDKP